jgi:glycosyltransferase involved in cell wall biosynthesis
MKPTQHILHVTQYLSPGGLERMILQLARETARLGHTAEVFVYDREGQISLAPEFEKYGIRVHAIAKEPGFSFATVRALSRLRRCDFTAIHSHDLGALIYASVANLGPGRIRHVHTQHSFIHLSKSSRYPLYEKIFTRFADQIIVVSPHQRADYARLGVDAEVIANGIDFPSQNPFCAQDEERLKRRLTLQASTPPLIGAPPDPSLVWFLYPGRIQKSKGYLRLFDLVESLPTEIRARARFVLLGAPVSDAEAERLRNRHCQSPARESVCHLGFSPEPLAWMATSDAVLSLSDFEGLPLVALEAIGLGLPTLLSDIEGHQSLKGHAAFTPLDDLTAARDWVMARVSRSFTPHESWEQGRAFRETYSLNAMAQKYLQTYEGAQR